jgi:hypothetical protein
MNPLFSSTRLIVAPNSVMRVPMKMSIAAYAMVTVVLLSTPPAAEAQYGAVKLEVRNHCLSDKDLDIIRSLKSLKRSTTNEDPVMPFNPDYFVGTWKQDWFNSEVPWSSAGQNTATATFKYVDNCYYEGQIKATGPDGPYTVDVQLSYNPARNFLAWIEKDSRGFTVVRLGDIGGHGPTSQQFTYRWEAMPFTFKGKAVHMTGDVFLTGPTRLRQDVVISVDGFTQRLGAPTLDRESPPPPD